MAEVSCVKVVNPSPTIRSATSAACGPDEETPMGTGSSGTLYKRAFRPDGGHVKSVCPGTETALRERAET